MLKKKIVLFALMGLLLLTGCGANVDKNNNLVDVLKKEGYLDSSVKYDDCTIVTYTSPLLSHSYSYYYKDNKNTYYEINASNIGSNSRKYSDYHDGSKEYEVTVTKNIIYDDSDAIKLAIKKVKEGNTEKTIYLTPDGNETSYYVEYCEKSPTDRSIYKYDATVAVISKYRIVEKDKKYKVYVEE